MSGLLRVSDFDFDLPPDLIAQSPVPARDTSRLLHVEPASLRLAHRRFGDLPSLLRRGDLVVLNDTKVFPARLCGRREPGGGAAECLLLGRADAGADDADAQQWWALVSPGARLRRGTRLLFEGGATRLEGEILERGRHGRLVRLTTTDRGPVAEAIERLGHIPLPPYIKRDDAAADRERYQTIYARHVGSIAAPTAGLHFTADVLDALAAAGVERTAITLHVGYGTFQPVRVDLVADHRLAPERFEVGPEAAEVLTRAIVDRRRIIAVGTTTTRTLESLAIDDGDRVVPRRGETALFIAPGHRFRRVQGLVTNFHVPRSSLLMLVSAFAGMDTVREAYRVAVAERYRFYSYGDAMVIL